MMLISKHHDVLPILSLGLSLAALAIVAGSLILLRRAGRERAELAQRLHDTALALDRRCDALQHQLDALALRQRIDHLQDLLGVSERLGRLDGDAARRLERYVLDLRDEQRTAADSH